MHTEHLQNVRPSWVAFGWFLSAAATALAVFAMIAAGLLGAEEGSPLPVFAAVALGFAVGGWFTGLRVGLAPILHGVGIGLFSLLVWFLANALLGEPLGTTAWRGLSPATSAGLLLLQIAAAGAGARLGSRGARTQDR